MQQYIISNQKKNLFLKINENGQPETTHSKSLATVLNQTKAKNILSNLPKTLRMFKFSVFPCVDDKTENQLEVLEDRNHIEVQAITKQKSDTQVLKKMDYDIPKSVINWMDRIDNYNNLINDASHRKDELFEILSNYDKELSNCLHIIEMSKWKNGCDGYKEYKKIKTLLEKRRTVKDELCVVQSITDQNEKLSVDHVVKNLQNRTFTIRDVNL